MTRSKSCRHGNLRSMCKKCRRSRSHPRPEARGPRPSRDAHLAPSGAMFDKTDSKGVTHRFRVGRVGYNMVDLIHVGTYRPGRGWERGSGDVYPTERRTLATMRRAPQHDLPSRGSARSGGAGRPGGTRSRERDRDYEAEPVGGWQREHGGYQPHRHPTSEEIAERHRHYRATTQSQAGGRGEEFFTSQGPGWDQTRRRRPRKKRRLQAPSSRRRHGRP